MGKVRRQDFSQMIHMEVPYCSKKFYMSYERTPATRSFFRIPPAPLRRGRGVPRAKHPGHGPSNRGVALDLTRLVKKEQTQKRNNDDV